MTYDLFWKTANRNTFITANPKLFSLKEYVYGIKICDRKRVEAMIIQSDTYLKD